MSKRRLSRRNLILILVLSLTFSPTVDSKVDPQSNRIRLMLIGECTRYHPYFVTLIPTDPKIDLVAVITAGDLATPKETKRYLRVFMPRTRDRFLQGLDVVELFDFVPWVLESKHIEWIHEAVKDHGFGMVLVEMGWYPSYAGGHTSNDPEAWMSTVLYRAYPVDLIVGRQNKPSSYFEIVQETPVVSMPGFEKTRLGGVAGLTIPRPGSTVHARYRAGKEAAIVSTRYGQGVTLTLPTGWDVIALDVQRNWKYFVDFVLNHIYFVADVPVPEDPELAHSVRALLGSYVEQKSLTVSFIDFIERFGANTLPLQKRLAELDEEKKEAERLYLESRYEESRDAIAAVIAQFVEMEEESVRIRKRALMWIYITEWIAVTGTSLLCTFVLWTLMVKKRLYREVETTRLYGRWDR